MARGWNSFYNHGKQDKKAEEIEEKRLSEGHSRCPLCGCGSFSLKYANGLMHRTCSNDKCGHKLEPIE